MIELSGLWLHEGNGKKYFSGNLGHGRLLIFKNDFKKEGENSPDYILYLNESQKKSAPEVQAETDRDIPF